MLNDTQMAMFDNEFFNISAEEAVVSESTAKKASFRLLSQAKMIDPTQRNALEVGTPGKV